MTITPIAAPRATSPVRARRDRQPSEADLFPFLDKVDVCIYCGVFKSDEQAEQRTVAHIQADLLAVHRADQGLIREFGVRHPGYEADVHDLLCELDAAERAASDAQLTSCPDQDPDCPTCTPGEAR